MVKLEDYEATVCKETWDVFQQMCDTFKERKLRVSFFNSTPQGGGGEKIRYVTVCAHLLTLILLNSCFNASCIIALTSFERC